MQLCTRHPLSTTLIPSHTRNDKVFRVPYKDSQTMIAPTLSMSFETNASSWTDISLAEACGESKGPYYTGILCPLYLPLTLNNVDACFVPPFIKSTISGCVHSLLDRPMGKRIIEDKQGSSQTLRKMGVWLKEGNSMMYKCVGRNKQTECKRVRWRENWISHVAVHHQQAFHHNIINKLSVITIPRQA